MSRERMPVVDAAWLHMDRPTNLMVVNSLMWFREPLDVDRVMRLTAERLVAPYPRFRQRVVETVTGPYWEDDPDFDLSHHVERVTLPAPGDRAALEAFVGAQMARPLDRARPLWRVFVVDGYDGGSALVSRMHHCIADGIALGRVLLSLTDEQPDAGVAPLTPRPDERRSGARRVVDLTRGAIGALAHEAIDVAAHPRHLLGITQAAVEDSATLARLTLIPPDAHTVLRGRLSGRRKAVWSDPIPLAEVKAVGRATGTTVNDVIVAALTGALRRYLADHGQEVPCVRASVPVNLRPLDEPLPRSLGNRFGLLILDMPVGLRTPPERLADVHRRMQTVKTGADGVVSFAVLEALGAGPGDIDRAVIDFFAAKASAVVTNVPGPRRRVYFAGLPVAGIVPWVPMSGDLALGVSIFSYDEGVVVGLAADPAVIPDPERLVDDVRSELHALRATPAASPATG